LHWRALVRAGWKRAQAHLVDRLKRRAIRRLHATRRGEALLLQIYLWAEESAEADTLAAMPAPPWLRAQVEAHLADERRHATMLRSRLRQLGHEPRAPRVDAVSRLKLSRLRRLAERSAVSFRGGPCVPLLAVAFRMEGMGVRVLRRHVAVLEDAPTTPTLAILRRILADESRHVTDCGAALERLVGDGERAALVGLIERIDRTERAFGISGALALLALAHWPRGAA
jgi:hypothetical protein